MFRPSFAASAVLALVTALGAGCASYTDRTQAALHAFESGRFEQAAAKFSDEETTQSSFLSGAEAGTVELTAGRWERARSELDRAAQQVRALEDRALVSPEGLAEGLASWVLNDTALPYQGEGYERVYLHTGMALAYLGLGRAADVLVEAKRANQLLESEEALYQKKYGAGGFGHLISALAYELSGELPDAYIDYQRMAEKDVGGELVGKALVRLSRALGRDDDHARWVERFGEASDAPAGSAHLIVLAGVGLGPYKFESSLAWPLGDGTLFTFAVPGLVVRPQPVNELRLCVQPESGPEGVVRTALVEDVDTVAKQNLDDRLAWMAAKSVARGLAKRELTRAVAKANNGDKGTEGLILVAGGLFQLLSERADLRCWQTLPSSWQAARIAVPAGKHRLALEAVGGERLELGERELAPGEYAFVIARSVDRHLWAHVVGGRAIDAAADAAEASELLQRLQSPSPEPSVPSEQPRTEIQP